MGRAARVWTGTAALAAWGGFLVPAGGCGTLSSDQHQTLTELEHRVAEVTDQRTEDARRLDEALRRIAVLEALPRTVDEEPAGPDAEPEAPPPAGLPVVRLAPDRPAATVGVAESPPAQVAPATAIIIGDAEGDPAESPEGILAERPYEGPGFGNEAGRGFLETGGGPSRTLRLVGRATPDAAVSAAAGGPVTGQGGTPSSAFGAVPRLPVTAVPSVVPVAPPPPPPPPPPPLPPPAAPAAPPVPPAEATYDRAMEAYGASRWTEAISLFDLAASQGLAEPHLAQSIFLRAEATFQAGDYLDAIGLFERLATRYAGSPRIPDAVVRIGMASERIGDTERAVDVYRQVLADHPGTRAAGTASRRLERLEGGP